MIIEQSSQDIKYFAGAAVMTDIPINTLMQFLPNKAFTNLWEPWIKQITLVEALIYISNSIIRLSSSDLIENENQALKKSRIKLITNYLKQIIVPEIVAYRVNDNPQEMIERVKII